MSRRSGPPLPTDVINCVRAPSDAEYEIVPLGAIRPGDWMLDTTQTDGSLQSLAKSIDRGALLYMLREPIWWAAERGSPLAADGLVDLGAEGVDLYYYRGLSTKTLWGRVDPGGAVRRLVRAAPQGVADLLARAEELSARAAYEDNLLQYRRICTELMRSGRRLAHITDQTGETFTVPQVSKHEALVEAARLSAASRLALAVWQSDTRDGELVASST